MMRTQGKSMWSQNVYKKVKAFQKKNSPKSHIRIQYFQGRTEFQICGSAHIHGAAWSKFGEFEES